MEKFEELKRKIKTQVKYDGILSVVAYRFLLFYRKLKYFRYKYKFITDDGIVLFEASAGFDGKIKNIYETMLYDKYYEGLQFVVALKDDVKGKYLIKDKNTIIVRKNSKAYWRYSSKAKYWVKNTCTDVHITPKKEQVVAYLEPNDIIDENEYGSKVAKILHKQVVRYRKKYTNYLIDERKINYDKNAIQNELDNFYKINNIRPDKILVQYKIYFKNFNEFYFDDYFSKSLLDTLYNKYRDKYQILINTNIDIPDKLIKKYKDFFVIASQKKEDMLDYVTSILITNDPDLFETEKYNTKNKFLFLNHKTLYSKLNDSKLTLYLGTNITELTDYLDTKKVFKEKKNMISIIKSEIISKNIVLLKPSLKHTFSYNETREILKKFFIETKIKLIGFGRAHFFVLAKDYKELKKYHNAYKGKRCFLIGNGPSLKAEDLSLIKDETSFACNLIYKIYDKTEWRPEFYFLADSLYIKTDGEELVSKLCGTMFALKSHKKKLDKFLQKCPTDCPVIYLDSTYVKDIDKYKVVSPISHLVAGAASVTTHMLNIAMYMGFDEIYLIGVDCTSTLSSNGHFTKNYIGSNFKRGDMKRAAKKMKKNIITEEEAAQFYHNRIISAYEKIEKYAKKHNIKIYNSTRGGALEVFERKQLEDVLSSNKVSKKERGSDK